MAQRLARPASVALLIGGLGTSLVFVPKTTLHAEAPPTELQIERQRKPIYDDALPLSAAPEESKPSPSLPPSSPHPKAPVVSPSPSPTDRLAIQIGRGRAFLQAHLAAAEDSINNGMTQAFNIEHSFTSTIASLAPPPETNERLLPGALYVLVAAMAGSIATRNRNILLRATAPVAVGIGAGWVVLPYTMRNVADLVWKYEEKVPVISMNHLRIKGAAEEGWRQARQRSEYLGQWANERVKGSRETLEGWVKQGK